MLVRGTVKKAEAPCTYTLHIFIVLTPFLIAIINYCFLSFFYLDSSSVKCTEKYNQLRTSGFFILLISIDRALLCRHDRTNRNIYIYFLHYYLFTRLFTLIANRSGPLQIYNLILINILHYPLKSFIDISFVNDDKTPNSIESH